MYVCLDVAVAGLGAGSGPTEHVGLYPGSTCNGLRIPAINRGNLLGVLSAISSSSIHVTAGMASLSAAAPIGGPCTRMDT
jgi:hypothetical protein